jgi:hypothetical protein
VLHGELVNLPARGMKGARWTGEEMCWRHAPEHYAAIHFHDDDLADAGWAADFELQVPHGLRSGVYAARLRAAGEEEYLPFWIRPAPDAAPGGSAGLPDGDAAPGDHWGRPRHRLLQACFRRGRSDAHARSGRVQHNAC